MITMYGLNIAAKVATVLEDGTLSLDDVVVTADNVFIEEDVAEGGDEDLDDENGVGPADEAGAV